MKKILIINTVGFEYDGITSVILNYTKGMNREGLRFVFPVYVDTNPALKEDLDRLGTTVVIPNRKKRVGGYAAALFQILREHVDVIHIHGNSGTMLIEVLLAKLCRVRNIVIHAHSIKTNHPLINQILKRPMMHLADTCVACSRASGDWLYGNHPYTVLNNAIALQEFQFSEENREKYRKEFGLKEEFLIGHVGHFSASKNHAFLIDVFHEFHKLEPKSKLLLISDGQLLEQVKAKVAKLGLKDAVIFAGRRNDVAGIYSAMDFFLLPSLWEGLGMVLVEAQANGLPALASDVITKDAICTDRVACKSLSDGAEAWASQMQEIRNKNYDRQTNPQENIARSGFDIWKEAANLKEIYMK